jgi:hypothetical protein
MAFIEVKPPALGDDLLPRNPARNQFAAVTDDGGLGKAGDLTIGNRDGVFDPLGKEAESRTEHDGDRGPAISETGPDSRSGCVDQKVHRRETGMRPLNRESLNMWKYRKSRAGPRPERRNGTTTPTLAPALVLDVSCTVEL